MLRTTLIPLLMIATLSAAHASDADTSSTEVVQYTSINDARQTMNRALDTDETGLARLRKNGP